MAKASETSLINASRCILGNSFKVFESPKWLETCLKYVVTHFEGNVQNAGLPRTSREFIHAVGSPPPFFILHPPCTPNPDIPCARAWARVLRAYYLCVCACCFAVCYFLLFCAAKFAVAYYFELFRMRSGFLAMMGDCLGLLQLPSKRLSRPESNGFLGGFIRMTCLCCALSVIVVVCFFRVVVLFF